MDHDTTRSARRRKPDSAKIKIKGRWTAIPNKLLKDKRLSRDARMLGCIMFMHAGNSERAFPSQEELADELSHVVEITETDSATGEERITGEERRISVRSVQRWLAELRKAGWLLWRQTLKNNEYLLLDPSEEHPESFDSEDGESAVSSPTNAENEFLTRATAVSPTTTQGSWPNATEGSPRATPVSCSNTTEGSPSNTTPGSAWVIPLSPQATPVSHSSLLDSDSNTDSNIDSSSPDITPTHPPGDDDGDVPTPTQLFLEEANLGVAKELREMPLDMAQRYLAEAKGRGASLPSIAKGLRALWQREQARRHEQAAAARPPEWLDAAVWPTLPGELRIALEGSSIDDEGYLCYFAQAEDVIAAYEATVKALLAQARREQAVGAPM